MRIALVFVATLIFFNLFSQNQAGIDRGYIVRISNDNLCYDCTTHHKGLELISKELGVYFVPSTGQFQELKNDKTIFISSFAENMLTELRNKPNDPFLDNQWYLNHVNFPKIWPILQDEINFSKEGIVIAVIEDLIDVNHVDLKENMFFNVLDIPNDGIDNDQNGYIDDYNGLNIDLMRGNRHSPGEHGTLVAGIIGGVSNNRIGISGIAPKVKVMPLSGVNTVAEIFKAFQYIYSQKKLYLDSNGEKGASITVANLSIGTIPGQDISGLKETWCDFHDLLGSVGIVSCGAAVNQLIDVEEKQELPSSCSSPFLINVTNIDSLNTINNAGFSEKLIHLAAPGTRIYGLSSNNRYAYDTGTSFAAPQVSAMIGVLSSLACDYYQQLNKKSPSEAAQYLVKTVLDGVTQSPSLTDKVITGGYLDMEGAIQVFSQNCSNLNLDKRSSNKRLAIQSIAFTSSNELTIRYTVPDYGKYQLLITDILGRSIINKAIEYKPFEINEVNITLPELFTSTSLLFVLRNNELMDYKHLFFIK